MSDQIELLDGAKYVLEDFSSQRPFSSFLPGIAGPTGIPLWVFYVNRGQAITSFGVASKDHPILEFQPANKAYQLTPLSGFRTFLKISRGGRAHFYEPFSAWQREVKASRKMIIGMNELEIEERQTELGLETHVLYFILPGEPFAALVRRVTFSNRTDGAFDLEILDGLPAVTPFGVTNWTLKEIGRTIEAWMAVYHLEHGTPFYRLQAGTEDSAEVEAIDAGHFALSFGAQDDQITCLSPIVDPELVFGPNTALTKPDRFIENSLDHLLSTRQITSGKTPCGFFGSSINLSPHESKSFHTIFGHLGNEQQLPIQAEKIRNAKFLEKKRREANRLAADLTEPIATKTSSAVFDAYCRQTYLDNVLRGGLPVLLGDEDTPAVYHIYTRKHGDPERDYNAFNLAPEPYSQGEVNYRDVNQNRRSDVLFNPRVRAFNIRAFMSLIQADGYNPLVIKGVQFTLSQDQLAQVLTQVDQPEKIRPVLELPFTPGLVLKHINDYEITLRIPPEDFLASLLQESDHDFEAAYGEGYWIDHWTYNLDLIDSYLAVYPDRMDELLFDGEDLPFYDSPFIVRPRSEKYVLTDAGPRQFEAVKEDPEKVALLASREAQPHWLRKKQGQRAIYRTTLFGKLVVLALVKFTTLDPYGMGIEMEADKPGWYDAMNGLPGLFGASMPESYALQRLLTLLIETCQRQPERIVRLPIEVWELMRATMAELQAYHGSAAPDRDFEYWDVVSGARERYRAAVRLGFDSREHPVKSGELAQILAKFLEKVQRGAQRAAEYADGVPATYFAYRVEDYEMIQGSEGETALDEAGRPRLQALRFTPQPLPFFLEGPMRAMRIQPDRASARALHTQVRASSLYDQKLKMYKVNSSLADQPHDIGRARAFTPGWLENESIWLHMEYKYLLEVLSAGLYEEFFKDFKNVLIPYQDPSRYGRSPLENSSFLVSSAHPDESLHGAGFVARLSGATAEFLSIWQLMMAGKKPLFMKDGKLCLALKPVLPGWLFDSNDSLAFTFLGSCHVVYHNPRRIDTYQDGGPNIVVLSLHLNSGEEVEIQSGTICTPYAEMVRRGEVQTIRAKID